MLSAALNKKLWINSKRDGYATMLDMWLQCRFLDTEVDGSNRGISMLCLLARLFIRIASVDSAVKCVRIWDNLMKKGVQCYDIFGGMVLKNHAFLVRNHIVGMVM